MLENGQFYPVLVLLYNQANQINWQTIISIIALIVAFITTYIVKVQQENTVAPVLELVRGEYSTRPESNEQNSLYPGFLMIENLGQGPGKIMAVNLDTDQIFCDIATPVSLGPGSKTKLKMWLQEPDTDYKIRLAIYYHDLNNKVYTTQWSIVVNYHEPEEGKKRGNLDWRISSERIRKYKCRWPKFGKYQEHSIIHWVPPQDLLDDSLLELKPFKDSGNVIRSQ
ncbi:MAG: hypothetical protein PHV07_09285 [Oscillospiraceae bacterium]|nr:hypothetical protein [Oscillospiraceae bacterium]